MFISARWERLKKKHSLRAPTSHNTNVELYNFLLTTVLFHLPVFCVSTLHACFFFKSNFKLTEYSKVTFSKVTKTIKKKQKTKLYRVFYPQGSSLSLVKGRTILHSRCSFRRPTSDTRLDKFNQKRIKVSIQTNKNRRRLFSLPHLDPNANSNVRNIWVFPLAWKQICWSCRLGLRAVAPSLSGQGAGLRLAARCGVAGAWRLNHSRGRLPARRCTSWWRCWGSVGPGGWWGRGTGPGSPPLWALFLESERRTCTWCPPPVTGSESLL